MRIPEKFLIVIVACLSPFYSYAQNTTETYKPGTFDEARDIPDMFRKRTMADLFAVDVESAKDSKSQGLVLRSKEMNSIVQLTYVGTSRPLTAKQKELLKLREATGRTDAKIGTKAENEYLFKEGDKEYWIPIEKHFESLLSTGVQHFGNPVNLYLIMAGHVWTNNRWEPVFRVQGFFKPRQ
jgi:hypothetical protein